MGNKFTELMNVRKLSCIALLLTVSLLSSASVKDTACIPVPAERQLKWHEAELGVVFHYDLHVFDGQAYGQGSNRITPVEDYNIFAPEHLDTDQWIRAAKAAGARFAILTATHETGFGLWQSDVNPYCLKAVRWRNGKGDIVADFVASCRKYGLQPGLYVGIRWNSLLGIHNFAAEGDGDFARNRQEWYRRYCERMVEELCSRYGDLFMIWFDGGADDPRGMGPDVEPIVDSLQPDCLFYQPQPQQRVGLRTQPSARPRRSRRTILGAGYGGHTSARSRRPARVVLGAGRRGRGLLSRCSDVHVREVSGTQCHTHRRADSGS